MGAHLAKERFEMDDPVLPAVELGQDRDEFCLAKGAHDDIGVGSVGQRDGGDGDGVEARHVVGAPAHRLVRVHVGPVVGTDQDAAGLRERTEILKMGMMG